MSPVVCHWQQQKLLLENSILCFFFKVQFTFQDYYLNFFSDLEHAHAMWRKSYRQLAGIAFILLWCIGEEIWMSIAGWGCHDILHVEVSHHTPVSFKLHIITCGTFGNSFTEMYEYIKWFPHKIISSYLQKIKCKQRVY